MIKNLALTSLIAMFFCSESYAGCGACNVTSKKADKPYGDFVTKQFDGISSRVFQHEFDHSEGVDFISRVSKLKRDMAIKKWRKKYGRTKLSLPL